MVRTRFRNVKYPRLFRSWYPRAVNHKVIVVLVGRIVLIGQVQAGTKETKGVPQQWGKSSDSIKYCSTHQHLGREIALSRFSPLHCLVEKSEPYEKLPTVIKKCRKRLWASHDAAVVKHRFIEVDLSENMEIKSSIPVGWTGHLQVSM